MSPVSKFVVRLLDRIGLKSKSRRHDYVRCVPIVTVAAFLYTFYHLRRVKKNIELKGEERRVADAH